MKKLLILLLCLFITDSFASGISGGTTAPCDNDTLNKYTGTANIEINWEPNVINLNWYDGDTKLNVAANAQSCTYDGMITVPPQPTKPGYTFNGWKVWKPGLPAGCTEIEYLQSDGNQWIDAGIKFDSGDIQIQARVYTDINFGSNREYDFFGNVVITTSSSHPTGFCFGMWENNNMFLYGYPSSEGLRPGIPSSTWYNITAEYINNLTSLYINGVNKGVSSEKNFYASGNIVLFRCGVNYDFLSASSHQRINTVSISINNVLVRDFVPVKDSNGVACMYDRVSKQFFYNAGTGTFTAGPVVQ